MFAEPHYQLGMAQGFNVQYDQAVESLNITITKEVIQNAIGGKITEVDKSKNGKTLAKMKIRTLEKQNESFKSNAKKQIEAFKGQETASKELQEMLEIQTKKIIRLEKDPKVSNEKVQTAPAVPVDVEAELSQMFNLRLILMSFLFSSCCALHVDQADHAPHHQPHHGAQQDGNECSTFPQAECCDVEKPRVERKTEKKCNTLVKKDYKPVQKSLQKTFYEDQCKAMNDEN